MTKKNKIQVEVKSHQTRAGQQFHSTSEMNFNQFHQEKRIRVPTEGHAVKIISSERIGISINFYLMKRASRLFETVNSLKGFKQH